MFQIPSISALFPVPGAPFGHPGALIWSKTAIFGPGMPPPFAAGCPRNPAGCSMLRPGCSMLRPGCSMLRPGCPRNGAGCPRNGAGSSRNRPGPAPISQREHPAPVMDDPAAFLGHPAGFLGHPAASMDDPAVPMEHPAGRGRQGGEAGAAGRRRPSSSWPSTPRAPTWSCHGNVGLRSRVLRSLASFPPAGA